MKKLFLFSFLLLVVLSSNSQVVINEVMYAPTSSTEKEWFEIYNTGTVSINLLNWKWKDATTAYRVITSSSIYLAQGQYVIICQDSAAVKQYHSGFSGIILQTAWSSNGVLNNDEDDVIIYDGSGFTVDSLHYVSSWGGASSGYSLERKSTADSTNKQSNWGTSTDVQKSTPNRINSNAVKQYDLFLSAFTYTPSSPKAGDTLNLSFKIKNLGTSTASGFSLSIFHNLSLDSALHTNELLYTYSFPSSLSAGDSVTYTYSIIGIDSGTKQYIGYVNYSPDLDTTNNKSVKNISVGSQSISQLGLVINEVMYEPESSGTEWFEIYNVSTSAVNLQNWKWKDATTYYRTITTQSIIIQPGSYAVVCEDSTILKTSYPTITGVILQSVGWNLLNNTGDNVILYNSSGVVSDSLNFSSSWGGATGYSLERKSPSGLTNSSSNWGTSTDVLKSTPNRANSLLQKQYDLALKSFTITPTSPKVGDTLKLQFDIKNIGVNTASNFTFNVYRNINLDSITRQSEIINTQSYSSLISGDSIIYTYNIIGADSGLKQYIGKIIYSADLDTTNNTLVKNINVGGSIVNTGIIINEIMYDPSTSECEWIELYNNSSLAVNMKSWQISDASTKITITSSDRTLASGDYLVLSKNSNIVNVHTQIDTTKIIYLSNLPTLNNDGDDITIYNSSGSAVDEVYYKSSWGGSTSKNSLERKSSNGVSSDSTNWATSMDCEYSSPTRANSLSNITGYSKNDLSINEIMYDPLTISCEWIEFYNSTNKSLNLKGWRLNVSSSYLNLYDTCEYIISSGQYLVMVADTTIYNRFSDLKNSDPSRKIIFNSSLSLSNSGAMVKVLDAKNNTIDSVYYSTKWHNTNIPDTKGYSLERINPQFNSNDKSNWNSCTAILGGTPGAKNSIYTTNNVSTNTVSVSPNPFSPDGDGFEDFTIIKYKLKPNIFQLRVKVYDIKGRLVRTLLNNQLSGSEGQIIFDGKNDGGEKLRIGIYILYIEAINDMGGTVDQTKATVVVAAKL
jgi:hypothetical protein